MKTRLELHEELCSVLGSRNVYFQPPESIKMSFPCIIYHLSGDDTSYADNKIYARMKEYNVTVVDKNPDSTIADRLLDSIEYSSFLRSFREDGLYHYLLTIYY